METGRGILRKKALARKRQKRRERDMKETLNGRGERETGDRRHKGDREGDPRG